MYNYNQSSQSSQYTQPTVLPIGERWERVLTYALGWVSGLIMLIIERRNPTVRRHAAQSIIVFGVLSILGWVAGLFGGLLGHIPLLGGPFAFVFAGIGGLIGLVTFVAWIGLMVLAYFSPTTFISGPRSSRIF